MDQALVSIIIPVYNSEKYIAEAIKSAIDQTWPCKEIIIVDDGSTDQSLSIAKSFASDSVKVFQQQNRGASAARNSGLHEAKGVYIQFLDADDLLSRDKIALQVKSLEQNPGKIAVCSTIHFEGNSTHTGGAPSPYEEAFLYDDNDPVHFLVDLLGGFRKGGSMISIHAWLVPVKIIEKAGRWNEELTLDDDGEFFSRAILNSNGIIKTGAFCYYRKYNDVNKTLAYQQNKKRGFESLLKAVLLKKDHLSACTNSDAAQRAICKQLLNLAVVFYLEQPSLYERVKQELRNYPDYHFVPVLGGRFLNTVTKIFGWKIARTIQYYYFKQLKN